MGKRTNSPKVAVCAGSYDPPTLGHLYVIQTGAQLFDRLIVAIASNPDKKALFSLEERFALLNDCLKNTANVELACIKNQFLVDFARTNRATHLLRGIRSLEDFEYEKRIRNINADLVPELTTVFLMPPRQLAECSSSFVRGLLGLDNWDTVVKRFLPRPVLTACRKKFKVK